MDSVIEKDKLDRRSRIALLTILWAFPTLTMTMALLQDWQFVWKKFGVPAMTPCFADLRVITSGIVSLQRGFDPLIQNPADPWHRPLNYPRIWLRLFSWSGVNDKSVVVVGILFCAFYLACISRLIITAKRNLEGLILLVVSLSIAPLFAIERGNTDLFVFSLVFLGCVFTNSFQKSGTYAAAAVLKLYPLIALVVETVRRPWKDKTVPALLTTLVIVLFFWQWRDIEAIRKFTPIANFWSYGVFSMKANADFHLSELGWLAGHRRLAGWAVVAGCWLAGLLSAGLAWNRQKLDLFLPNSTAGEMFSVFGAIYAFSFAIGSNWDYRLIFLIPTMPLAFEVAGRAKVRWWGCVYIALVVAAENSLGFITNPTLGYMATLLIFLFVVMVLTLRLKAFWGARSGVTSPEVSLG
jgi:hypothetical protein